VAEPREPQTPEELARVFDSPEHQESQRTLSELLAELRPEQRVPLLPRDARTGGRRTAHQRARALDRVEASERRGLADALRDLEGAIRDDQAARRHERAREMTHRAMDAVIGRKSPEAQMAEVMEAQLKVSQRAAALTETQAKQQALRDADIDRRESKRWRWTFVLGVLAIVGYGTLADWIGKLGDVFF
jgi:hypothetical protein